MWIPGDCCASEEQKYKNLEAAYVYKHAHQDTQHNIVAVDTSRFLALPEEIQNGIPRSFFRVLENDSF